MGLGERRRAGEDAQVAAHVAARAAQFERLGEPHRPGDQRRKGKPDHDDLHEESAFSNMPQGDRSCGSSTLVIAGVFGGSAAVAGAAVAAGASIRRRRTAALGAGVAGAAAGAAGAAGTDGAGAGATAAGAAAGLGAAATGAGAP